MSGRRKSDGLAARQRTRLPRRRKSLRLDLRYPVYEKLVAMSRSEDGDRPEPLIAVIERLILESPAK
jgi:hypothetical protein